MGGHRSKNNIRFAIALTAFLCYLVVAFMVFFASVDNAVNKNTVELLRSNVQKQSYHFEAVIDLQFNTLEVALQEAERWSCNKWDCPARQRNELLKPNSHEKNG